jgi:peptidoglycan hydrolase-like protein with peptidoglycan-binding domain
MKQSSEKLVVLADNLEKLAVEFLNKAIQKQAQVKYPPELVKTLQQSLNTLHFGNLVVDGEMGTETKNALNNFYKWKNVPLDPSTPFDKIVGNVQDFAAKKLKDDATLSLPTHHTRH